MQYARGHVCRHLYPEDYCARRSSGNWGDHRGVPPPSKVPTDPNASYARRVGTAAPANPGPRLPSPSRGGRALPAKASGPRHGTNDARAPMPALRDRAGRARGAFFEGGYGHTPRTIYGRRPVTGPTHALTRLTRPPPGPFAGPRPGALRSGGPRAQYGWRGLRPTGTDPHGDRPRRPRPATGHTCR